MKKIHRVAIAGIIAFTFALWVSFELGHIFVPLQGPHEPTDVKIVIEQTPCFGSCPVYSVTIHGNGSVVYEGKQHVRIKGTHTYQIPQDSVKELVGLFYERNYFSLDDTYESPVTDHSTVITHIKVDDKEKTVSNYAHSGPDRLHEIEDKINELANTASFLK